MTETEAAAKLALVQVLSLRALSCVVLMAAIGAAIGLYGIYWAGRAPRRK